MSDEPYFRAFEEVCRDLGGRPHRGKMRWGIRDDLRPAYLRCDDFLAVRDRLDPQRGFDNE